VGSPPRGGAKHRFRSWTVEQKAHRAERLGFDALHVSDHLGAPAPFPTLMATSTHRRDRAAGDPLAERITFIRNAAVDRFELNIAITAAPTDDSGMPDLTIPRRFLPTFSDEELLRHPGVLSGSPRDITDRIRAYRDSYGITYIIVQAPHAEAFGKVIDELR
jgi:alkanesulfonate monooxygenase SsuD/methylene tetrahydromethanopterin reductase-like flavin-dependent oxidoreductase (luciferase family)